MSITECIVEMERPNGAKMRTSIKNKGGIDFLRSCQASNATVRLTVIREIRPLGKKEIDGLSFQESFSVPYQRGNIFFSPHDPA
jgi:hypothetical protein